MHLLQTASIVGSTGVVDNSYVVANISLVIKQVVINTNESCTNQLLAEH